MINEVKDDQVVIQYINFLDHWILVKVAELDCASVVKGRLAPLIEGATHDLARIIANGLMDAGVVGEVNLAQEILKANGDVCGIQVFGQDWGEGLHLCCEGAAKMLKDAKYSKGRIPRCKNSVFNSRSIFSSDRVIAWKVRLDVAVCRFTVDMRSKMGGVTRVDVKDVQIHRVVQIPAPMGYDYPYVWFENNQMLADAHDVCGLHGGFRL